MWATFSSTYTLGLCVSRALDSSTVAVSDAVNNKTTTTPKSAVPTEEGDAARTSQRVGLAMADPTTRRALLGVPSDVFATWHDPHAEVRGRAREPARPRFAAFSSPPLAVFPRLSSSRQPPPPSPPRRTSRKQHERSPRWPTMRNSCSLNWHLLQSGARGPSLRRKSRTRFGRLRQWASRMRSCSQSLDCDCPLGAQVFVWEKRDWGWLERGSYFKAGGM